MPAVALQNESHVSTCQRSSQSKCIPIYTGGLGKTQARSQEGHPKAQSSCSILKSSNPPSQFVFTTEAKRQEMKDENIIHLTWSVTREDEETELNIEKGENNDMMRLKKKAT